MKSKIIALSKNQEFKKLLQEKKVSNKYVIIYFGYLEKKNKNRLNISFVTKKKIGNAVKRNKVKRRLRNIMNQIVKIYKINLSYSYLLIAKKEIINAKFSDIKKTISKDYKKIKWLKFLQKF